MAENSDAWKAWYKSDYPDQEPLPMSGVGIEEGKDASLGMFVCLFVWC